MAVNSILVVDDNAADLENLRSAAGGLGARVITARSGEEAVEKARSEKPDLILMDIVMDGLDGFGACREITHGDDTRHIPVIFVSSKNQRADRVWAEKQGARAMIRKPYTHEAIAAQVRNFS